MRSERFVITGIAALSWCALATPAAAQTAMSQTVVGIEDQAKAITLSCVGCGSNPTYTITQQPRFGRLTGTPPNVTYTPNANHHFPKEDGQGADIEFFTFEVEGSTGTVNLVITPVNDPPELADIPERMIEEDGMIEVTFTATDPDVDGAQYVQNGDMLSYVVTTQPANGLVSPTPQPNVFRYAPNPNYAGVDGFTVTARDLGGATAVRAVVVRMAPVNDAPVAPDLTVNAMEERRQSFRLECMDPDLGDALTYQVVVQPTNGSLDGQPPSLGYTPQPNFMGEDTFTYTCSDGVETSNSGTVTIVVGGDNDVPTWGSAAPVEGTTHMIVEGDMFTVEYPATDPDLDLLEFEIELPADVTLEGLEVTPSGQIRWTPDYRHLGMWEDVIVRATDGVTSIERTMTLAVAISDEDGDLIPKTMELAFDLSPVDSDSDNDFHLDGLEFGDFATTMPMPIDTDGDGVIDALDDDSDDDGVPDIQEVNLMNLPLDSDSDGILDFREKDADADGVEDLPDNCRATPNADQRDFDMDDIGDPCDLDDDNDNIIDFDDDCPFENADEDGDGQSDTFNGCKPREPRAAPMPDSGCFAPVASHPATPAPCALLALGATATVRAIPRPPR